MSASAASFSDNVPRDFTPLGQQFCEKGLARVPSAPRGATDENRSGSTSSTRCVTTHHVRCKTSRPRCNLTWPFIVFHPLSAPTYAFYLLGVPVSRGPGESCVTFEGIDPSSLGPRQTLKSDRLTGSEA